MKKTFILLFYIIPISAHADMPLSIEEILTTKGRLKLEASLSYINRESKYTKLSSPIFIQTGVASFISIPTNLAETEKNNDIFIGTLGLRYGLTGDSDIYINGSYISNNERNFNKKINQESKDNSNKISNISFGISHTFLKDNKNPAVIGFLETSIYEKLYDESSSGKSWLVGTTIYKAIDPVVLSLTTAYRLNSSKKLSIRKNFKAGNYWLLNPSIAFAANDRISFTGGIQWLNKQPDRLEQQKESTRNTSTYAHFGVGLGFSRATSLNASARFNISGQSNSELKFGILHTF